MLKSSAALVIAVSLASAWIQEKPTPVPSALAPKQIEVRIDGRPIAFTGTPPQAVSGRAMAPLRGIMEALGAYVEYEAVTRTITVRKETDHLELRLGDRLARKNGMEIILDVPPMILKGSVMVPLRFLAEALGGTVRYDKAANRIDIQTLEEPAPTDG